MHFASTHHLDGDIVEREFFIDEIPGYLWTPTSRSDSTPLILLGHPGGLSRMYPRLLDRARQSVRRNGFAVATIELPGSGDRPRLADVDEARDELHRRLAAGEPVDAIVDRLIGPLVDASVPEWQTTIDSLLTLPDIDGPVGYAGGVIAIGVRLAVVEPRIVAAGLFAGSYIPAATFEEARRMSIPVQVLLQWDDEGNDRQASLDLFDAIGSAEKSLHANMGGHTGVPHYAVDDGSRFFVRHLT